jgi:hypothetical protein
MERRSGFRSDAGVLPQGNFAGFQPEGFWPTVLGIFHGGRGTSVTSAPLKAIQCGTVTFSPAIVGAISVTEQAVTIAGLLPGDVVCVNAVGAPTANVGNLGTGRVSAAGTFQLRYVNPTAGGLTPPASTVFQFVAFQVA